MKRIICMALACLLLSAVLVSCMRDIPSDETTDTQAESTTSNTDPITGEEITGKSEFKFFIPKSFGKLKSAISDKSTHYLSLGLSQKILNREPADEGDAVAVHFFEDRTVNKFGEYRISRTEELISISVHDEASALAAFEKFYAEYLVLTSNNIEITLPVGEQYLCLSNYPIQAISIGDKSITDYKIATKHTIGDVATKFRLLVQNLSGQTVELEGENDSSDQKYINIDLSNTIMKDYAISCNGGDLNIKASFWSYDKTLELIEEQIRGGSGVLSESYSVNASLDTVGYDKEELRAVLLAAQNDSSYVICGQKIESYRSDPDEIRVDVAGMKEVAGDVPGIINFDLIRYKHASTDGTPTDGELMHIADLVEHASKGGIVMMNYHFTIPEGEFVNPNETDVYRGNLGDTYEERQKTWADLVTEDGNVTNKSFTAQLEILCSFIQLLKDNGVPIIFRQFHEHNANWFWWGWGHSTCNPDWYRALWIYTYNYITQKHGLDNMLFDYCANSELASSCYDVMGAYPGSEYVDIISLDWYTDKSEIYYECLLSDFRKIMADPRAEGKIISMAEYGPHAVAHNNKDMNEIEWTGEEHVKWLKRLMADGVTLSYYNSWTSGSSRLSTMPLADKIISSEIIASKRDMAALFEAVRAKDGE